jgi:hypothetical protein
LAESHENSAAACADIPENRVRNIGTRRIIRVFCKLARIRWARIKWLRASVEFHVEQHNTQMPHAAFSGQTPDEIYFGTAANLPADLAAARDLARAARLAANRGLSCDRCLSEQVTPPDAEIPP